jgi:hypothetical protein
VSGNLFHVLGTGKPTIDRQQVVLVGKLHAAPIARLCSGVVIANCDFGRDTLCSMLPRALQSPAEEPDRHLPAVPGKVPEEHIAEFGAIDSPAKARVGSGYGLIPGYPG